jgi:hypothetical protein
VKKWLVLSCCCLAIGWECGTGLTTNVTIDRIDGKVVVTIEGDSSDKFRDVYLAVASNAASYTVLNVMVSLEHMSFDDAMQEVAKVVRPWGGKVRLNFYAPTTPGGKINIRFELPDRNAVNVTVLDAAQVNSNAICDPFRGSRPHVSTSDKQANGSGASQVTE